ncbi:unnamed protein product [Effrenium voratum]|nr:unnamed protein product [Effrenium voratum]
MSLAVKKQHLVHMASSTDVEELPAFSTALMFKLNRKMSPSEFRGEFHALLGYGYDRPYDFVHLPWSSLAIVNFTSAKECAQCYASCRRIMAVTRCFLKGARPAKKHGLLNNLADCLSKEPTQRRPLIFLEGSEIPWGYVMVLLKSAIGLGHTTSPQTPRKIFFDL